MIPDTPDALLRRRDTAAALTAAGFPIATPTLATKATRGGGPPYRRFGAVALYRWGDALDWARSRLSPPRCSTSESDAATSSLPPATHRGRSRKEKPSDVARRLNELTGIPSRKTA
jgi:hypothetical protein